MPSLFPSTGVWPDIPYPANRSPSCWEYKRLLWIVWLLNAWTLSSVLYTDNCIFTHHLWWSQGRCPQVPAGKQGCCKKRWGRASLSRDEWIALTGHGTRHGVDKDGQGFLLPIVRKGKIKSMKMSPSSIEAKSQQSLTKIWIDGNWMCAGYKFAPTWPSG